MKFIEIDKLQYHYPEEKREALHDISLKINKGEVILIAGESGSGKSTLVKCITGAIPDFYGGSISGNLYFEGKKIEELTHREKAENITMVFQDPEKQIIMNKVHREVAYGLENIGIESKEIKRRVWEAMQFTNILSLAYRDTSTLSGGEKQKVAIASAIAYMPKCIVFDEPTSQLDPTSSEEIMLLIKKINEELGITIIIVEQKVEKCFEIADKIVIMKKGKVEFFDYKEKLYNSEQEFVKNFLPVQYKLTKELDVLEMPTNFRNVRQEINKFHFNKVDPNEIKQHNEIITMKNVSCGYNKNLVLDKINLSINSGEFLVIMGSNGSGKSTLLKSIMGLIKYSGSIKVENKEVKKNKITDISKIVGYLSQNPNDYISHDTVYDEIKFTLDNYAVEDDGIIDKTLSSLDILHLKNKNPRDLSGGERQRVAAATIMVLNPQVLLLDEPTRGLDETIKDTFGNTLLKFKNQGRAIVMVTHDIEFAAKFADRFVLVFNGEIVNDGTKEEVLGGGIYYTTIINKLLRDRNKGIFTLKEALDSVVRGKVI